jgi:hypothetical protein
VNQARLGLVGVGALVLVVMFPAAPRAATLAVTTTSVTDTPDGHCDIVEALAAATTMQPVHGDCPAGDGADEIVLADGATYTIDATLRVVTAVQFRTGGGGRATITAGGIWRDDPADPWSDCALFVSGDGASLTVMDLTLAQAGSATALSGACVTAGSLLLRRVHVTGFARGGIVSLCDPASRCDHDQLGQASTVSVYSSLIDLNSSPANGGGISSKGVGASVIVEHASIVNNAAQGDGGGVAFEGGWNNQRIASSTLSGNAATNGGAISVHFAPATNTYLYLLNSTVANNTAAALGGGIAFTGDGFTQDVNVYASIVTNNAAGTDEVDINGDWGGARMSCTSSSLVYVAPGRPTPYALPGAPCRYDVADARLGPLMSMGGEESLPVVPLLPGSPAIDAASDDQALDEQRDEWIAAVDPAAPDNWTLYDRVVDGDGDGVAVRDLGAYEVNLRWQTELLAVAASGPSPHTVVTTPSGFDRGAGTSYAAAGAGGEFVTYLLPVAQAGSYAVKVGILKAENAGSFQLAVADAATGPWTDVGSVQDTYAAGGGFAELGPLAAAAFGTPGQKALRFTVAGKNPQSAGYQLFLDYISFLDAGADGNPDAGTDGSADAGSGGNPGGGCGCRVANRDPVPGTSLLIVLAGVALRRGRRRAPCASNSARAPQRDPRPAPK